MEVCISSIGQGAYVRLSADSMQRYKVMGRNDQWTYVQRDGDVYRNRVSNVTVVYL